MASLLDTTPDDDVAVWLAAGYPALFPVRSAEDLDGLVHASTRAQSERVAQRGAKGTVAKLESRLDDVAGSLAADRLGRLVDLRPTLPAAIPLDDFLSTGIVEFVVRRRGHRRRIDGRVAQHGRLEVIRTLARAERSRRRVFPASEVVLPLCRPPSTRATVRHGTVSGIGASQRLSDRRRL